MDNGLRYVLIQLEIHFCSQEIDLEYLNHDSKSIAPVHRYYIPFL